MKTRDEDCNKQFKRKINFQEYEGVRDIILESWKRCRKNNVDPNGGVGKKISDNEMERRFILNDELISVAKPIMNDIYSIVCGSGFSIFLTDKDGCLLEVIADEKVMEKAKELNFNKGAVWTEEAVGTNAIGTALYLNRAIQTIGKEHFCRKHHSWTCSAAVIHDEYGRILGCLDMSGEREKAHSHTLGMVITAAKSIEKQLALNRSNKLINAAVQSISDGMIILDESMNMKNINDTACKILKYSREEIINMDIKDLIIDIDFINKIIKSYKSHQDFECDFYMKNKKKIKCSINAVPILINNKITGIVITFKNSSYVHKVANKVVGYKAVYRFQDIITQNFRMRNLMDYAKKAALTNCNILINGESGTGKELFAQSIHNYSLREKEPFIAINCASIPRELMESELFGYEKGAFTGAAKEGSVGKFELADGGTIFLDEIGELPLDMQSKLLRVLDNKRITRIGGSYEKELNVRVIAATNRDLINEIDKKNFREDLFYRLNVMNIKLPSLRDRPEDIDILTRHFIDRLNNEYRTNKIASKKYIETLIGYNWFGNIRELQNIVERSYYLCESNIINESYLTNEVQSNNKNSEYDNAIVSLYEIETENIINALKKCSGSAVEAAKILGMSRATIYRKMKKYKIEYTRKSLKNEKC